jgi:hypothetical protein
VVVGDRVRPDYNHVLEFPVLCLLDGHGHEFTALGGTIPAAHCERAVDLAANLIGGDLVDAEDPFLPYDPFRCGLDRRHACVCCERGECIGN